MISYRVDLLWDCSGEEQGLTRHRVPVRKRLEDLDQFSPEPGIQQAVRLIQHERSYITLARCQNTVSSSRTELREPRLYPTILKQIDQSSRRSDQHIRPIKSSIPTTV